MKQSIDFQVVDKAFKGNKLHRLTYLNIFEPSFEDLNLELRRFINIYFENYATVSDLLEILYCILCHVVYEFKSLFEDSLRTLLETVNNFYLSHTFQNYFPSILFEDIINEKCIYHKPAIVLSKEQYSVFVKVIKDSRCVYLGLFLKRLLIIRICNEVNNSPTSMHDLMAIQDLEESMSRIGNQEVQVIHRNNDNYSVMTVSGADSVTCAAVSAKDWCRVALGLEDGSVLTAEGSDDVASLIGHSMPVTGLKFTKESERLLTCSLDHTVRIWDPEKTRCEGKYRGHNSPVWSVSTSPTVSQRFVSGGMDGSVCLWDVHRSQPVRKMVGHLSSVKVTGFHNCGRYVASGSDDGHVRLWDVRGASCVRLWESKSSGKMIGALDINSESSLVAWGTDSGSVECVSLDGGMGQSFNVGEPVMGLVCRRGGVMMVATVSGNVYVLDSGDQLSKMVTDECGRLLGLQGTVDMAGPVLFIRET